ncbi:CHC2 zinc finger domain-containing protein [Herbidospora cretacea]|uniref:CHC2 zinc finger domain-containing protein n=1 Tax=Herbidospora cretacea TaxID=28444 RepID=UPI0009EECE91
MCCPFPDHPERRASFSVNSDKGVWVCYSCPGEPRGGGAIQFIMRMEEIPYEAAKQRATEILGRGFQAPRNDADGESGSSLLPAWARAKHGLNRPVPARSRRPGSRR